MSTFSDLPRYPRESADADRPPAAEASLGHAAAVAQVAGEVLFFAMPIVGWLWLALSVPVLLAVWVATNAHDSRTSRAA